MTEADFPDRHDHYHPPPPHHPEPPHRPEPPRWPPEPPHREPEPREPDPPLPDPRRFGMAKSSTPIVPLTPMPFRLECVVICVNFSDVLAFTLPANKIHFDRMIVVSDLTDEATKNLCSHNHVELVQTDAFYAKDQAFNKANGINVGLQKLNPQAWVLHMDADIVLPPRTGSC